jgi:hypothetical protein
MEYVYNLADKEVKFFCAKLAALLNKQPTYTGMLYKDRTKREADN